MSLFLTGTGTGVGKTFVAVQLLQWLRARGVRAVGMKPICCGDRADAFELLAASAEGVAIDELNPVWLKSPVAPSVAARFEQVQIDLERIGSVFLELSARFDAVIVEGVGGWLVPIARNFFVRDLAKRFGLPVAIVAENRLGCLNHVLLTIESVRHSGLRCAGVILNRAEASADLAQTTNEAELRRILTDTALLRFIGSGEVEEDFSALGRDELLFKKLTQL